MFKTSVLAKYCVLSGLPTVIVPKGSMLFHGSLEPFSGGLKPGGDGMIWFADNPNIAQLYIPESGGSMWLSARSLAEPNHDPTVQELQKKLGIKYDYSEVEWENQRAKSWRIPEGWKTTPTTDEVKTLMEKYGYKSDGSNYNPIFKVRVHGKKILEPNEIKKGRLFIAKVKEPLLVWKKALGESDLMNRQYNDIQGFKKAKKEDLDGVLIDDFAQSKEHGNLGHASVGLYNTKKLEVKSIEAQYREWEYGNRGGTPEYPNPPPMFLHKL